MRWASGAAVLAALAVLSGCGDSPPTKEEYVEQARPILKLFAGDLARYVPGIRQAPTPVLADARIVYLRDRIANSADALEQVDAPAEIRPQHRNLVVAIRKLSRLIGSFERRPGGRRPRKLATLQVQLQRSQAGKALSSAILAFDAKGYDLTSGA